MQNICDFVMSQLSDEQKENIKKILENDKTDVFGGREYIEAVTLKIDVIYGMRVLSNLPIN